MRRLRLTAALALCLTLLSMLLLTACTSGNLGSEEIAFVRDGALWTISPDGTNAFKAVAQDTPVLGYGLSPNHQIFVFRTLDSSFAKTSAATHLVANPITGLAGDVPSTLNTVGIDGGSSIPIIVSGPHLTHSSAWWSPDGNRLLYREGASSTMGSPDLVTWIISQDDQPMGIARKSLPGSFSIPSIDARSYLAIGNSALGIFTTTLAGTNLSYVQRGVLPGHPLPASLERVLWQPAHAKPAILYAIASAASPPNSVTLVLRMASGQTHILTNCACEQFAWSPTGNSVLYSTPQGYTVLTLSNGAQFHFHTEHDAIPYWSPDGRAILLDGLHTLTLVHVDRQQTQVLLSDGTAPALSNAPLPNIAAFLQPVANNLWNVDGQRFVLVTRGRTQWRGQQLNAGNGLYTVLLNNSDEPWATPSPVDENGSDIQPGWSYEDPTTSFLF